MLPKAQKEDVARFVIKDSIGNPSREIKPFNRQVDFWAFSIGVALAKNLDPVKMEGTKFIETSQGILNEDLASLIAAVSVSRFGPSDPKAINPSQIIGLANELAAAGCGEVLKVLNNTRTLTTPLARLRAFSRDLILAI